MPKFATQAFYKRLTYIYKVSISALALTLAMAVFAPVMAETKAKNAKPSAAGFAGSYLSGVHARASGDIPGAIRFLQDALNKDPGNPEVASQLQGVLLLDGRVEEAVNVAREAGLGGSNNPVSDLLLTLSAVKRNDMAGAGDILAAAFESGSGQLWLPLVSAWLDVERQRPAKPLALEDMGENIGRAAPIVSYHLALINDYLGFKDAAARNFRAAVEGEKDPPGRIIGALLEFYEEQGEPKSLTPLVNAWRAAHQGQSVSDEIAKIEGPKDGIAEVLFTMGSVMHGAGVMQDAAVYLQLAVYLQPEFPAAQLMLGDAYAEMKQYVHSSGQYAKIPPTSAFYPLALLRTSHNLERMGRQDEAVALLDSLARKFPKDFTAPMSKGDLYRMRKQYAQAVDAYTQTLSRIPALRAEHWPVIFARGVSYERLGQWTQAEQDLKRALALKPDQPDVLNYLGYGWLSRGEHIAQARAMIETAIKARPDDAQIVDSMGWALYLQGHYDEAADYLEKAVGMLPGDPTVNDHLGDVYWRLGRKTEARFQWERSLTFSPGETDAAATRRKLEEGLPDAVAGEPVEMPAKAADGADVPMASSPAPDGSAVQ